MVRKGLFYLLTLFFFHHYFSSVVHFTVKPVSSVIKMGFTCCFIICYLWSFVFVVCSTFISSGCGLTSLRMCHNLYYFQLLLFFNFFNASHLGSFSSSFESVSVSSSLCKPYFSSNSNISEWLFPDATSG